MDEVRIGTAEREESAKLLADHFALGRLLADEYETRVLAAYSATTMGELRPLFADLPAPHPAFLAPPPAPMPMPYAPPPMVYQQPMLPQVYSYRSKTVAGVLQIVLPFGVGRFYTGQIGLGLLQLFVFFITLGVGAIWPIIDGIVLLANGGVDAEGRPLRP